jgi:hypothetical protein
MSLSGPFVRVERDEEIHNWGVIMKGVLLLGVILAVSVSVRAGAAALEYDGGPVVSNAQVVLVNWSTDISPAQAAMPAFYADILTSDYWSILTQYGTPTTPSQPIGFGTYVKTVTLTGGACTSSCTVDLSSVEALFESLINSNDPTLPPLSKDSAGNLNTIFMVHFAPTMTLTIQGSISCQDFGGAYDNITVGTSPNTTIVPIGLIPDCSNSFPVTEASSGVLAQIVTDPQVSSNPAWYTSDTGGDVFSLCNETDNFSGDITVNGHVYDVATLWSNASNKCVTAERIFVNGFESVPVGG